MMMYDVCMCAHTYIVLHVYCLILDVHTTCVYTVYCVLHTHVQNVKNVCTTVTVHNTQQLLDTQLKHTVHVSRSRVEVDT